MYKTGGYTECHCAHCNLVLGHTIIALVDARPARVKCNTCQWEHVWRDPSGAARRRGESADAPLSRPAGKPTAKTGEWHMRMNGRDANRARLYNPAEYFEVNEIIKHNTFGAGLVMSHRDNKKMDVLFESGVKTLVFRKK
ncbi:MAG: hypothetical protein GMKNLPBB_00273 [Myxococcota bacterium]|nr:hypothetical protein [Myxococcota bacterium]